MFQKLIQTIEATIANAIFKAELKKQPASAIPWRAPTGKKGRQKVGRNQPCPCGKINPKTNKPMKYKKCCYPKFG